MTLICETLRPGVFLLWRGVLKVLAQVLGSAAAGGVVFWLRWWASDFTQPLHLWTMDGWVKGVTVSPTKLSTVGLRLWPWMVCPEVSES